MKTNVVLALTLLAVARASVIRKLTPAEVERLANWNEGDKQNIWEISGQFQGDMVLSEEQRNGLLPELFSWPNKTMPYVFDPSVTKQRREYVEKTIKIFEEVSCVKIKPRTEEVNYLYITTEWAGCWAYIGHQGHKVGLNLQPSFLGTGCFHPGTIIHEFLHALGFVHQHSSSDRDEYVDIKWENIAESQKSNFNKFSDNLITNLGEKYDYGSIMHYSEYAGSFNGGKTIVPKDPTAQIGQRNGLSPTDIAKLNKLYVCDSTRNN